jgi:L-fuconolactonase
MSRRADAHLHLFRPGYAAALPASCRRKEPDEVTLYAALAEQHAVEQALVIGYEGEPWAAGNNAYLAELAPAHAWLRPVAFVDHPSRLDVDLLERLDGERFVGLSLYLFEELALAALANVPAEVWAWLERRRWLISVNSRGDHWAAWLPILDRHPSLRLLVSHLGLPAAVERAPSAAEARSALGPVLALARFAGVRVKLSGFYALATPGYDYPHQASWPYAELLVEAFSAARLLWGSDFSPSLEWLSFPQTFGLFAHMPFLGADERRLIEGENLLALLAELA